MQARYAAQAFRQVDLRLGIADLIAVHHADGGGSRQFGKAAAFGGHHHGLFAILVLRIAE
ncbi:hypothetical protein D3C79_967920 [compost metagenome]